MRRLKLELKQTMDMYSTACKEALNAKQKVSAISQTSNLFSVISDFGLIRNKLNSSRLIICRRTSSTAGSLKKSTD